MPHHKSHGSSSSSLNLASKDTTASANPKDSGASGTGVQEGSNFDCNICLELARDPVITLCGHLFCWPCLYQWMQVGAASKECPVCKAGVEASSVIPLYGRGKTDAKDPRKNSVEGLPNRPPGQRPTPQRNQHPRFGFNFMHPTGPFATAQIGNFTFSAGFGLFPALFGVQFQAMNSMDPFGTNGDGRPGRDNNSEERTLEQQQQRDFLSKLLVILGSFVILCLIYF